jgi:hypothetical protein
MVHGSATSASATRYVCRPLDWVLGADGGCGRQGKGGTFFHDGPIGTDNDNGVPTATTHKKTRQTTTFNLLAYLRRL